MKLEEIQQLQPELVERFTQILEHKQLSHAYLFTGSFASFEMALLLAQSQFCEDLQGVWPCGKCRSCRIGMHLIRILDDKDLPTSFKS